MRPTGQREHERKTFRLPRTTDQQEGKEIVYPEKPPPLDKPRGTEPGVKQGRDRKGGRAN
jgi:hypothetical protein